jgi:nucleotide-binding universal stress UspA family protein
MSDRKPVIVTTDGSPRSQRIIPHAARFAAARQTDLVLLRVVEEDDITPEPNEDENASVVRNRARLEADLEQMLSRSGVSGTGRIEERHDDEKTIDAILRVAAEGELLVMASRGRGGLAHILQGSVSLGVMGGIEMPVMISGPQLTPPPSKGDVYRVLMTTDCSAASEDILRTLAPLLEPGRFRVLLLHVHEHAPGGEDDAEQVRESNEHLEQVRKLLPSELEVETFIRNVPRGGGVDTAIIEKALEWQADAVAMSTHGHSARRHLLMGSLAMSMLGRSPVPLILARK